MNLAPLVGVVGLVGVSQVPGGGVPVAESRGIVAIMDVTVIPMDRERTIPDQTVLVQGDRVVTIGPAGQVSIPPGSTRIDGHGKYLMPGLADMHVHVSAGEAKRNVVERMLFLFVANGVLTIRNMRGAPADLALRAQVAAGGTLGPRIYTAAPQSSEPVTPATAARLVFELQSAGYDFLKLSQSGRFGVEAFDSVAAAAFRSRFPVAAHVPSDVGLKRVLDARIASIEHLDGYLPFLAGRPAALDDTLFWADLERNLDLSKLPAIVAATREGGVWNCPTQAMIEDYGLDVAILRQRPELRFVRMDRREGPPRDFKELLSRTYGRSVVVRRRIIKALHEAGAGLLLGSDVGAPGWLVPGFAVHRELEALVAAGLTPYEALETGTRNAAVFLGALDSTGTVAVGKRADLILLDHNPLSNIRHTGNPAGIMLGGRWLPRDELAAELALMEGSL